MKGEMATTSRFVNEKKRKGPPPGFKPCAKSLSNLIPFPKGVNPNPHPGESLTVKLRRALTEGKSKEFIEATIAGAIALNPTAFREVWDRVEGKVAQPVTGPDGGPIQVLTRSLADIEREEMLLVEAIALLRGQALAQGRVIEGRAREIESHAPPS